MPRAVRLSRTYRAVPATFTFCVPPVPLVTVAAVDQDVPSVDVWTVNALPYAASHTSVTWSSVAVWPRSTWKVCGSAGRLAQRVAALPSTAFRAGV